MNCTVCQCVKAIAVVAVCCVLWAGCTKEKKEAPESLSGTIAVSGAWALYPMVVKWAEEYQKLFPAIRIDISAGGAGKGMADALGGIADIGMVSRAVYPEEITKGAWWVSVTKDAVLPTVNATHPYINEILSVGLTKQNAAKIWIDASVKTWNDIVAGLKTKSDLHVYTRSDACGAAETWAAFLGKKQEDLQGVGVYGDPGVAEAVKKDALGIGYNNVSYAYDAATKREVEGIRVLPLDLNANGIIDEDEKFYDTRDAVMAAIAAGKYPAPPARDLNFVTKGKPEKPIVKHFINWVLTDGQVYVADAGYINLTAERIAQELKKMEEKQ